MKLNIENIIDQIKDDPELLKGISDLKNTLNDAKSDKNEFLKKQATKTARYLTELNDGVITKKQFEMNMQELSMLLEQEEINMEIRGKATAQKLRNMITNFLLKTLISKVPF